MRLLALVPSLPDRAPGQRFRIEQWIPYLKNLGWDVVLEPFADHTLDAVLYRRGAYLAKARAVLDAVQRRITSAAAASAFDAVYVYREAAIIGPSLIERAIARRGVPVVYDFDDPIWLPYLSPTNGIFSLLKFQGKTRTICRLASHVVVGNRLLASWAAQHSDRVSVIPSTIEFDSYAPRGPHVPRSGVRLGWTGSHSTLSFLETIREPLRALRDLRDFELQVISHTSQYDFGDNIRTIAQKWRASTEAEDLHSIDIGLAPFPDSGWTPWRCHGKILQYMAVGLPVVASPVGIVPDYIRDGENGFLADTPREWVEKLTRLIDDPALRCRLGAAARTTIAEHYSAALWAPRFEAVMRSVAGQR